MPFPIGREESYDILRPFLPEDAKRVLEKEIPRIRKQIDGEIDDFVNALSEHIQKQAAEMAKEIEDESKKSTEALDAILSDLNKNADAKVLIASAEALKAEVTAYKNKWASMGKNVQKAVLLAAKSVGLPVPTSLG